MPVKFNDADAMEAGELEGVQATVRERGDIGEGLRPFAYAAALARLHLMGDPMTEFRVGAFPEMEELMNNAQEGMLREFANAFSNDSRDVRPELADELEAAMGKLAIRNAVHYDTVRNAFGDPEVGNDLKGFAFGAFARGEAIYLYPPVTNLPIRIGEMPMYHQRNSALRIRTGERPIYLKPFLDRDINTFIGWVNDRLREANHQPMHVLLTRRFTEFCKRETTAADFPAGSLKSWSRHSREMPPLAGVPGTHAETILYNNIITTIFDAERQELFRKEGVIDYERMSRSADKIFSHFLRIYTVKLINSRERIGMGEEPYPLFPPCIGCETLMGSIPSLVSQNSMVTDALMKVQKEVLQIRFEDRLGFLRNKYGTQ